MIVTLILNDFSRIAKRFWNDCWKIVARWL